jgi:DNA repair photolyase
VCQSFNQPVGIITKNAAVLLDADILQAIAAKNLVSVLVSINSLNEPLRSVMEPRTTTATQRLRIIETLSKMGVRTGVMLGPMIPGLNEHEMQPIMEKAAAAGARFSAYTFIRLNGAIGSVFKDWLFKNFPDRANKVWHLIEQAHGGQVNDTRWGVRMRGEGPIAALVQQQFKTYNRKYQLNAEHWQLITQKFMQPGTQGTLF